MSGIQIAKSYVMPLCWQDLSRRLCSTCSVAVLVVALRKCTGLIGVALESIPTEVCTVLYVCTGKNSKTESNTTGTRQRRQQSTPCLGVITSVTISLDDKA